MSSAGGTLQGRSETVETVPWSRGLRLGFGAGILAVLITFGLLILETTLAAGADNLFVDNYFLAFGLQFFLNAHIGAVPGQIFAFATAAVPFLVFQVVPVGFLVGAGRRVASVSAGMTTVSAGIRGATVAVGYSLAVVATVILGKALLPGPGAGTQFVRVVLVAGLIYPLIFGALGGLTAGWSGTGQAAGPAGAPGRQSRNPQSARVGQGSPAQTGDRPTPQPDHEAGVERRAADPNTDQDGPAVGGSNPGNSGKADDRPVCVQCGAVLAQGESYCGNCGAALD